MLDAGFIRAFTGKPTFATWLYVSLCHSHLFTPKLYELQRIEVKFEPEHVAGVEPRVEPITADVVDKMERFPDGVEITQTSSSNSNKKKD
jgi:hypothetical protein